MKIFRVLGILSLCFSILLTGCQKNKSESGVLRISETADPQSLDSAKVADAVSINVLRNIGEGLYTLNEKGEPVLGMAAEEPKKEGLTYTFKIRDNAYWSDHTAQSPKPVTAHDFVYGINRSVDSKVGGSYAELSKMVKGWEAFRKGTSNEMGVKALDDKTLQITLDYEVPYLKEWLAWPTSMPQRKDIVEKAGANYGSAALEVCNGPYKVSEWKRDSGLTYVANENYYDKENVKIKKVEVSIVKDGNSQANLYNTNKVDAFKLMPDQLATFKDSKDVQTIEDPVSIFLEVNHSSQLYKNMNARKAISLAINREELTKNVRKDGSQPLTTLVPSNISAAQPGKGFREVAKVTESKFDAVEAKKLWDQATKELGMEKPVLNFLISDKADHKMDANFIAEQLKKNLVNIDVKITPVPNKVRLSNLDKRSFDIAWAGWGADYNDVSTFTDQFVSSAPNNHGKWSSAKYDQLVSKANKMGNSAQRDALLAEAEGILLADQAIIPLYTKQKKFIVRPSVHLPLTSFGGDYLLKFAYFKNAEGSGKASMPKDQAKTPEPNKAPESNKAAEHVKQPGRGPEQSKVRESEKANNTEKP